MDIKQKILDEVEKRVYVSTEQLAKALGTSVKKLKAPVTELLEQGVLGRSGQGKLAMAATLGYFTGTLEAKAAGFAFLRTEGEQGDIFINQGDRHGALNGDTVLVRLKKHQGRGANLEGKVLDILSPLDKTIVGRVTCSRKMMFVDSGEPVLGEVFIPKNKANGAKKDQMVVARLTKRAVAGRRPEAKILEVLGMSGQPGMDVLAYVRRFGLVAEFPPECEEEANALRGKKLSPKGRLDFRTKLVLTIDGADAKDLDDAVSLYPLENGNVELAVHIADVSHYVRPGSELNREALERGTSVYLVDRVVPMLPKALSDDLCSLNPHEDKYTVSCVMEINRLGRVVSHVIAPSVIRSSYRMTYDDVNGILEGDSALTRKYAEISELLLDMNRLAKKLRRRRFERGSVDFDLNEAEIMLDGRGVPYDVVVRDRRDAQKLIEEFMLMANITVAQHYYKLEMPFLYRIHEQPDAEKMQELAVFLGNFGIKLHGAADIQPMDIQEVLNGVEGTPLSNVVNSVTLRSLKKARYDVEPVAHFGLAAEQYCHFTSPIRRYPDLMVHRIIKMQGSAKEIARLKKDLPAIAKQASERERNAIEAERAVDDMKMAEYMSTRVGSEFEGVVSGVTRFGIFVELENTIEGMIPLARMDDDYYVYNEKLYCVVGERTAKKITLGDNAKIRVVSVDTAAGKIEFEFAE